MNFIELRGEETRYELIQYRRNFPISMTKSADQCQHMLLILAFQIAIVILRYFKMY